jgi:hypothetical protein
MRSRVPIALLCAVVATAATGCGDEPAPKAPLGSAANPQQGRTATPGSEVAGTGSSSKINFRKLVESQQSRPGKRFTPCVVTRGQARVILGAPVLELIEAPQGPTCIYRPASGKGFVTIAVQRLRFDRLKREIGQPRRYTVAGRTAYCGGHRGQSVLYMQLARGRVLSVTAPCDLARRFAVRAAPRLVS